MPRETDLLRVKLVAHTLLDVQIQETALSPVLVSHPFTNSGISALRNEDGSLSMVDLINNSDDCTRWRKMVGEQIDSAKNVHQIFVLFNPPYYLTLNCFFISSIPDLTPRYEILESVFFIKAFLIPFIKTFATPS